MSAYHWILTLTWGGNIAAEGTRTVDYDGVIRPRVGERRSEIFRQIRDDMIRAEQTETRRSGRPVVVFFSMEPETL